MATINAVIGERVQHWHSKRIGTIVASVPANPDISEYAPNSYHVRWNDGAKEVELVPGNQLVIAPDEPAPEPPAPPAEP